jgi:hypothetical protein
LLKMDGSSDLFPMELNTLPVVAVGVWGSWHCWCCC